MAPKPTLLLTRPKVQSERFADQLQDRLQADCKVVISPIIETVLLEVPPLDHYAGVIFTSENAVRAAHRRARPIPAYCVGPRTARVAEQAGFNAQNMGSNAGELTKALLRAAPDGPLVHLRGEYQTGDLSAVLQAGGLNTTSVVVYDQPEQPLTDKARAVLGGQKPLILPVFSPRSAQILRTQALPIQAPLYFGALSQRIADVWRDVPTQARLVSARPDADSMIQIIDDLLRRVS